MNPNRLSLFRRRPVLVLGLGFLLLAAFRTDDPAYQARLDQWHSQRVASLKAENGWLNLAGLFWLKEGANQAGSDAGGAVVFPAGTAPARLGTFQLQGGTVTFRPEAGVRVTDADGQFVTAERVVFSADQKTAPVLQYGSLKWFIIKRGDRYAIRLRDLESPALKKFAGIERYPVREAFRVQARLEPPAQPRTIAITDVTGQVSQQPLVGTLVFSLAGKPHRLDAVGEGSSRLFILFGDETNGHETYGSGRFLYADRPDETGLTTLDFNQSINPPCAFTPYATCPLPPRQNRLAVAIPAGEKRYGTH